MGETVFLCEYIVTSPKVVKTLYEQIITDINKAFFSSVNICNYLQTFTSPIVFICKFTYLFPVINN